jgi:hypothetical protein
MSIFWHLSRDHVLARKLPKKSVFGADYLLFTVPPMQRIEPSNST